METEMQRAETKWGASVTQASRDYLSLVGARQAHEQLERKLNRQAQVAQEEKDEWSVSDQTLRAWIKRHDESTKYAESWGRHVDWLKKGFRPLRDPEEPASMRNSAAGERIESVGAPHSSATRYFTQASDHDSELENALRKLWKWDEEGADDEKRLQSVQTKLENIRTSLQGRADFTLAEISKLTEAEKAVHTWKGICINSARERENLVSNVQSLQARSGMDIGLSDYSSTGMQAHSNSRDWYQPQAASELRPEQGYGTQLFPISTPWHLPSQSDILYRRPGVPPLADNAYFYPSHPTHSAINTEYVAANYPVFGLSRDEKSKAMRKHPAWAFEVPPYQYHMRIPENTSANEDVSDLKALLTEFDLEKDDLLNRIDATLSGGSQNPSTGVDFNQYDQQQLSIQWLNEEQSRISMSLKAKQKGQEIPNRLTRSSVQGRSSKAGDWESCTCPSGTHPLPSPTMPAMETTVQRPPPGIVPYSIFDSSRSSY